MTPKNFRRARRLVARRPYYWLRSIKFGIMFRRCDRKLLQATPYELDQLSEDMTRFAIKQAWYKNKLK